jgi:CubicO group peptidase (beta-lactamase class C family)
VGALSQIDGWDVGTAAAAILTPTGVVSAHGPADRTFPLASVSKVLTSVAVHVAVVLRSTTPSDAAGPPGSTVRHLLAHTSGLPPDGDRTPLGPPERKRIYSNVGFEVLGEHVTERTGMPFEEYARLALVEPLGLTSTDVSGSPAHAHSSSVDDLCRLLQAVVCGELLASSSIDVMTTPAFPDLAGVLPGFGAQDPNPWGLGVEVRGQKDPHWTAPSNSPGTWGHFGRAGTFVWWDPAVELGLVALTDREFGPWAVEAWPALASAVLAEQA